MYSNFFARDLFSELGRLQREMRQAVETASPAIRGFAQGFPALNVGSTPESVEIYAFAPGIDPSKIEVDLDRRVLTIAGERAGVVDESDRKSTPHLRERFEGRFRRVVSLPEDIDPASVEAGYRDGVLQISVKRRGAAQPRRVTVQ